MVSDAWCLKGLLTIIVLIRLDYDAMTTSPIPDAPYDFHTTLFPTSDDTILPGAQKLVQELKQQHYYTDTANFDLRCQVCKVGLKGETGARQHAMQ
jgi:ubiquitin thioesterase OTU1